MVEAIKISQNWSGIHNGVLDPAVLVVLTIAAKLVAFQLNSMAKKPKYNTNKNSFLYI